MLFIRSDFVNPVLENRGGKIHLQSDSPEKTTGKNTIPNPVPKVFQYPCKQQELQEWMGSKDPFGAVSAQNQPPVLWWGWSLEAFGRTVLGKLTLLSLAILVPTKQV